MRGGAAELRRKADTIFQALAIVGIDAAVPGEGDLALGPAWLARRAGEIGVPLVAANLACPDEERGDPEARLLDGSVRLERDGVVLGIVGVIGTELSLPEGCRASNPAAAVRAELAELGEVDAVVVLAHAGAAERRAVAEALPRGGIVVAGGHDAGTWSAARAPAAGVVSVSAGTRGKRLGVLEVELAPGARGFRDADAGGVLAEKVARTRRRLDVIERQLAEARDERTRARLERRRAHAEEQLERLERDLAAAEGGGSGPANLVRNHLVALGEDVPDHAPTRALVDAWASAPHRPDDAPAPGPGTLGPYAGGAACAGCHPEETAQWAGTAHARAWETLVREGHAGDPSCWSCHATGIGAGGPAEPVDALVDVGCEGCHGPSAGHAVHAEGTGPAVADPGEEVCQRCHDGERDGGRFDYATYRPRVVHRPAAR